MAKIKVPPFPELSGDEKNAESRQEIQDRLGISERKAYQIIHHYANLGRLKTVKVLAKNISGDACAKTVYWIEDK